MIIQNSLRQVVRTPVRTSLFVTLLVAVTAFLAIGINLHLSAALSIAEADEAFTTIGTISFRDLDNSDLNLPDIMNYDYSPIVGSKYVRLLDRRIMLAGVADVTTVFDDVSVAPSRIGVSNSVIEFTPLEFTVDGKTAVQLLRVPHSYRGYFKEGKVITLVAGGGEGEAYQLQPGKKYITSGYESFQGKNCSVYPLLSQALLQHSGFLGEEDSFASIMEITSEDFWESEDGLLWAHLVEILQTSVQTLNVYTTNDLATMRIFNQGKALIASGRPFTQAEYDTGAKVCIINAATAKHNGLQVGDRISLAISEQPLIFTGVGSMAEDFPDVAASRESYEIIGLYTIIENMGAAYGLHEDTVFVPQRSVSIQPDNITVAGTDNAYSVRGDSEGISEVFLPGWENFVSFRLVNGSVEAFKEEMAQRGLSGLNFAYYDQGYSKISGALSGMKETAAILTAICAAAGLGIGLLFALLFVGRQQRSIAIMYSLGAGRKKALAFLMFSVLLVAGIAVAVGGFTGHILSDVIAETAYTRNIENMGADTSYSGVSGEDSGVGFHVVSPPGHQAPLAAAAAILAVSLIPSSIFAARVLKAEPMQVLTSKEE